MDNKNFKLMIMMQSITTMFQEALETVGMLTLDKYEKNMELMNEDQKIEFLSTKLSNPYTEMKQALIDLEAQYEEFKADPEQQVKVQELFEQMLDNINNTEESESENEDDEDDNTKH